MPFGLAKVNNFFDIRKYAYWKIHIFAKLFVRTKKKL